MKKTEAFEMAPKFRSIGGFTRVEVDHHGVETEGSEKYQINLWSINATAGNRNLEVVSVYTADDKAIARIARSSKGVATAADKRAYARIEASAAQDRE